MVGKTWDILLDEDKDNLVNLAGYSATWTFMFKKSEHLKKMTVWTAMSPECNCTITVYGIKGNQNIQIGSWNRFYT